MALFINGVDFEDNRIKFRDWPALKSKVPFGALPVLEIEGRPPLANSNAILAYIGREHGHHPTDSFEAARHESIFNAVEDLRWKVGATDSKDEAEKKRKREEFASGYLPIWANGIEQQIEGPFIAGEQLSLADLKVFIIAQAILSGTYDHIPTSSFDSYPKLKALVAAVLQHPKVAAWRSKSEA